MRSVQAVIDLGQRRKSKGDVTGAAEAFQLAAAGSDTVGRDDLFGALHLWILWSETRQLQAADEAYLRAVGLGARSGLAKDQPVAEQSLILGSNIAAYWSEFYPAARLALRRRLDSEGPEAVSLAAMGFAGLEMQQGEEVWGTPNPAAVVVALRRVIDIGHPDYVPAAAHWLAFVSERTGDVDSARVALRAATEPGESENACHAALDAAKVFKRAGHAAEAIAALRFIVDNSRTGRVVIASQYLGELLAEQGDVAGAKAAYQYVLDNSEFPHVIEPVRAALDRL